MSQRNTLCRASLAALALCLLFCQISFASELKIICIGDSITQGGLLGREEYTYRWPLQQSLSALNVKVDFIGTRQKGLDADFTWPSGFDPDHEGFYGAKTAAVRDAMRVNLPALPPPDIALIHLGSNDEGDDPTRAVVEPLSEVIGLLRNRNPKVKILVAQIPGTWKNMRMHYQVWRMARRLNSQSSPVVTVPFDRGWSMAEHTFDGSHPNRKGQSRMAEFWLSELRPLLGLN